MKRRTEIVRVESKVLGALCQGTVEGPIREFGCALLREYHWQNPIHQIIFQVLMAIPSERPDTIRAQLPVRLTRMGFPDVAWEDFFAPSRISKTAALRLLNRLTKQGRAAGTQL
jgi:hypothetical protein